MLRKINRISRRKDFLKIRNKGILFQSSLFGLAALKEENLLDKRFGFIISKKIAKKAVTRNKIRRILSDIVKNNLKVIQSGWKGIFLIKKNILDADRKTIESETEKILRNLK